MDGVVYEHDDVVAAPPLGEQPPHGAPDVTEEDEDLRALAVEPEDAAPGGADAQLQQQQQAYQQQQYAQYQAYQQQQQYQGYGGAGAGGAGGAPPSGGYGGGGGGAGASDGGGKLFIGGVSWETTEDSLRSHFGKYGALTDAALMKDKFTGQPRGFGFVTFADSSAIDRVLEESHVIDGRTVEVKRAIPRDKSAGGPASDSRGGYGRGGHGGHGGGGTFMESKKIFVGGLAPSVGDQDFRQYFEEFGKITDAVVMIDRETQRSRGFGFITFEEEGAVAEVISKSHEIHGKVVEIKRAEPKEMRAGGGGGGYGGRGGGGGYGGRGYGGGGYAGWRGANGGGYGGGGYGGGGYGGRGGGGYGAAAAYGGGYGGGYGGYGGYPAYGGYAGYGGGGRGGGGYGGYPGYGGYMGGYGGYGAPPGGEGGARDGAREGGAGGEEGGYPDDGSGAAGGPPGGYGGYGYGGGYRQGGNPPASGGGRSERYRPY